MLNLVLLPVFICVIWSLVILFFIMFTRPSCGWFMLLLTFISKIYVSQRMNILHIAIIFRNEPASSHIHAHVICFFFNFNYPNCMASSNYRTCLFNIVVSLARTSLVNIYTLTWHACQRKINNSVYFQIMIHRYLKNLLVSSWGNQWFYLEICKYTCYPE